MSFSRLDDAFYSDPDVMAMGLVARALYIAGLVHCARGLTDGFIAAEFLGKIAVMADVEDVGGSVLRLVSLKVWLPIDGGYRVRNWQRYNHSAEKVREDRADAEARKADGRARGFAAVERNGSGRFTASTASSGEAPTAQSVMEKPLTRDTATRPVPSVNPSVPVPSGSAAAPLRAPAGATGFPDETDDGVNASNETPTTMEAYGERGLCGVCGQSFSEPDRLAMCEHAVDSARYPQRTTNGVALIDPVHDPPIEWFQIVETSRVVHTNPSPNGKRYRRVLVECRPAEGAEEPEPE